MSLEFEPLPIRKRQDSWEVTLIAGYVEPHIEGYIRCDSQSDAKDVADLRPLTTMAMMRTHCNPEWVRRCISTCAKYGLDARAFGIRRLMHFADECSLAT